MRKHRTPNFSSFCPVFAVCQDFEDSPYFSDAKGNRIAHRVRNELNSLGITTQRAKRCWVACSTLAASGVNTSPFMPHTNIFETKVFHDECYFLPVFTLFYLITLKTVKSNFFALEITEKYLKDRTSASEHFRWRQVTDSKSANIAIVVNVDRFFVFSTLNS